MKCSRILMAVAASSCLLHGGASGAYTGLTVENKPSNSGNVVCNVYANFDNPNDVMVSVAGTPSSPMNIEVIGGEFYQNPFGGDLAPNPVLFDAFPSLADDTFLTIGKKTSNDDHTGLTPGWPGFGASSLVGSSLSWFITPDQVQGMPIDGKVLLAQFSAPMTPELQGFQGTFLIQAVSDGNTNFLVTDSFYHPVAGGMGACCLMDINGTCLDDIDAKVCEDLGGVLQGDGLLCADVECPVVVGACCIEDIELCLSELTVEQCTNVAGVYSGAGSVCEEIDCFLTGACCLGGGDCLPDVQDEECLDIGGVYQGDNVLCSDLGNPDSCPWDCGGDGDGVVGTTDLLVVLAQWAGPGTCDFDGCEVHISDLLSLLGHWGPCQ